MTLASEFTEWMKNWAEENPRSRLEGENMQIAVYLYKKCHGKVGESDAAVKWKIKYYTRKVR